MPGEAPEARKTLVLEQYKSLVADVGNIGTRYATANGFYLSVLTALLGVLAYVGAGRAIDEVTYPVVLLVAVFGSVVCWIWRKTIEFYGKLFGGKFDVLKKLELELPVWVYHEEYQAVYVERKAEPLTEHEAKVPKYLGWFFLGIAALSLILFIVKMK
jgi:hypothetical protein